MLHCLCFLFALAVCDRKLTGAPTGPSCSPTCPQGNCSHCTSQVGGTYPGNNAIPQIVVCTATLVGHGHARLAICLKEIRQGILHGQ